LGLDEAGRGDFEEVVVGQRLAEGGEHVGAKAEDARGVLSAQDEVAEVGLNRRIGFLECRLGEIAYNMCSYVRAPRSTG
jgi:hypothetical protein